MRNHGLQGLPRVDGRHDPYATPDDVEFKQVEIPQRFYATGGTPRESWRTIFYANLIKDFADESNGRITSGGWSTCRWVVMGETGWWIHDRLSDNFTLPDRQCTRLPEGGRLWRTDD